MMDAVNQSSITGTLCCDNWWGSLTSVQKIWLHSHLWDLEILAGWTSEVMVQALESHHSQQTDRYSPVHTNGV